MKKHFGHLLWSAFMKVQVLALAGVGIVVSAVPWYAKSDATVKLGLVVPVGLLFVLVIAMLVALAHDLHTQMRLPSVRMVTGPIHGSETLVCLLEPSDLFSHGTGVSFLYVDENGFEVLLGTGEVAIIQENKLVQVAMTTPGEAHVEIISKLRHNDANMVKRLLVKPGTPRGL